MLYHLTQYISNSVTQEFLPAIGQRVKYTANTAIAGITLNNPSLTGGTIGTDIFVIMTGASNGTLVRTVTFSVINTCARGMIRLFVTDSATSPTYKDLIAEIEVPSVTIATSTDPGYGTTPTFSTTIETDFMLQSGLVLLASAESSGTFRSIAVVAEGLDTTFP